MKDKNFTTTLIVNATPETVFAAINDVRGWWSEDIEGSTDTAGEAFDYHFKELHRCRIRVAELLPGKKVVWHVESNHFSFTKHPAEWAGTDIVFEIGREGNDTKLVFTHRGLTPDHECFNVCHDAWTGFIQESLRNRILTDKGQPNPRDGVNRINSENVGKWKLGE